MIITQNPKSVNTENLKHQYKIAFIGNPNVGKSTLFNALTKQDQHTGNWSGKTVDSAKGYFDYKEKSFEIIDLPGTYSLNYDSREERVTTEYISYAQYDAIIIVVNTANLKRSLLLTLQTLALTNKAVLCLNMTDESDKKGMYVDTDELNLQLGIPVVKVSAKNKKYINLLLDTVTALVEKRIKTFSLAKLRALKEKRLSAEDETILLNDMCNDITKKCTNKEFTSYTSKDSFLDKLFTSKITGIPLTLLFFSLVFWLTAFAANYPSEMLSKLFNFSIEWITSVLIKLNVNAYIISLFTDGILTTASWVVSVMLPPAVMFFILFALLEDSGYLPRIAFNLDRLFLKSGTNGKMSITMLMGLGCNACGVMGCRIMRSKKERQIGIITNSFVPCNGRIPTLIAISSLLLAGITSDFLKSVTVAVLLMCVLTLSFIVTFVVSYVLSKFFNTTDESTFMFELPPYRVPQFKNTIVKALKDKVLYVLSRAVIVSIPTGAVIWFLSNINIIQYPIIRYITDFFEIPGRIMGIDGIVLAAFFLGFPANEIVFPIILMIYTDASVLTEYSNLSELSCLLSANGWTYITYICFMIFTLFHFPCSTTIFSIYKETKSIKHTIISIILPLIIGMVLCAVVNVATGGLY